MTVRGRGKGRRGAAAVKGSDKEGKSMKRWHDTVVLPAQ